MRIKSLDLSGFKSFGQRAHLAFGNGITGVVGPNGCGKSNVVDAIRWVLGEMSAKHLRGRGMQDVIFAGAEGRAPQNMAEVTLQFSVDGDAPAPFTGASEIAVTRRLFRDGTSEYLLNKQTVRLRDIVDLFLGTGVGTRAYSIIEQGRIGFVVSAKPEERRQLIEEVAGISRFKSRKKAAERRMAATEQNLARVRDVLGELDSQLASLQEQAERARTYRQLKATLYELELHRASYEWLRQRLLLAEETERCAALDGSTAAGEAATEQADDHFSSLRQRLGVEEQRLLELHKVAAAAEAAFVGSERDLSQWRERAAELTGQAARAAQRAEQLQGRHEGVADELGQRQLAAQEAQAALAAGNETLEALQATAQAAAQSLATVEQQVGKLRQEALGKVQAAAEQRGRLASLAAEVVALTERNQRLGEERAELEAQQALLLASKAACEQELGQLKEEQTATQAELEQVKIDEAAAAKDSQAHKDQLRQQGDALSQKRHRLASLTDVVARLDGYQDGVRALLGSKAAGQRATRTGKQSEAAHGLKGLIGVVAEVLEVPAEHERAIEAVLGERLQYVRVEDRPDAHAAMQTLRAKKLGRGGFVPTALTPQEALPEAVVRQENGVLGAAASLVRAGKGEKALLLALLGRAVLVDSLATAEREARRHAGLACVWVTPEGESVDGQGLLVGGATSGAGLLANRREMRALAEDIAAGVAAQATLQAEAEAKEQHLVGLRQRREALRGALHRLELAVVGAHKNVEAKEREERVLARTGREAEARVGQLAKERERADAALLVAEQAVASLTEQGDEERERLALLEASRQEASHRQQLATAEATERRVALATEAERAQQAAAAVGRLERELQALAKEQAEAATESRDKTAAAEGLTRQADEGAASMDERSEGQRQAQSALAEAEASAVLLRQAADEAEQALRELRSRWQQDRSDLGDSRLAVQKLTLAQATLCEQVAERHDVDLLAELIHFHSRPAPTKAAEREEQRLAKELKQMGAINLMAISACEALEARATFLRTQQQDLERALASLRSAVHRIDEDSQDRFQQAFAAVDAMFQQMYPRLFGGGSARLVLTEAEPGGEPGIDMVAMPPGKKLQNVSLLSGGEKALTATALVFAIFLIKPSPFCILDEVDAPLDEANVGRFNDMLREMSQISQFIVITHNKQTMLQVDRLYGITMEDRGLSKVVAVDLADRRPSTQAA